MGQKHYHVYAGYQALEGWFGKGFLPAGWQTVLNPWAYVPAYWLAKEGLSEQQIAVLLAVVQGVSVWFVALIARDLYRDHAVLKRWAPWLCGIYAWLTPVFLDLLGGTSADLITAVGVLCGVWCGLRARLMGSWRWAAAGGLAMGLAAGIKLSNLVPLVIAPVLLVYPAHGSSHASGQETLRYRRYVAGLVHRSWRLCVGFALAAVVGGLIATADWSLRLYRATGNPVFPFFNH